MLHLYRDHVIESVGSRESDKAMGHGNSNKLYITHAEHTGQFGSHSASVGYRA
jgi:hypothetical protein